ncbi:conserved hypothetical protein [Anaeromyxobacter dehalogenans 2CP-1]|uniref:Uncharacterized protein n=1 Tax=Anaeromyxobacter dehalogenans (strain ATCC BAA-258 / DSM 21875 / 2CP-1) TaxID=455488 RepID=B8JB10_ANAD2|nr:hypothetical protein [Anaeromyxobacter dehalogenans]ACL63821.1 conserved hypothetical protein [Anaeromyxobacter dehalogenans 2CP-1]
MGARAQTRSERLRRRLQAERVHLVIEYVTLADGSWAALCGMPEAIALGATYAEARERLCAELGERMGRAALEAATVVEDVPFGAEELGMAY